MFPEQKYFLRKKILKFIGEDVDIYNERMELVAFVHKQGFKLKESVICYSDKSKSEVLFTIKARNILDFAATYDVVDAKTNDRVGALRRKGFKSMLVDEWIILDSSDNEVGLIKEDNLGLALVRRMLLNLIPQDYDCFIGSTYVADFKQNFNPFVYKLSMDFSLDTQGIFDKRMGIAMGILLAVIEGKQD